MEKKIVAFFFVISLSAVLGSQYDITTVYKFNTYEEADLNGEITRTYLDTCDVSVHPQTNAVGLPFMNINGNKTYPDSIIYPLKLPTIPTLQEPFENTQWRTLTLQGAMENLGRKELFGVDPRDVFNIRGSSNVTRNNKRIREANAGDHIIGYRRTYISYDSVFSNYDLTEANKNQNIFLSVRVKKSLAKDFKFRLLKSDGNHVNVRVNRDNNLLSVCRLGNLVCGTYNYEGNMENQIYLYVTLGGDLIIFDVIGQKKFNVGKNIFGDYTSYSYIGIDQDGNSDSQYSRDSIMYEIVQISHQKALIDDKTIVSPWLYVKNGSSFYMSYYRKGNSGVQIFLRDKDAKHVLLELKEEIALRLFPDNANIEINVDEVVLARVDVRYSQNWTEDKQIEIKADKHVYITNIWEMGNLDTRNYKMHEKIPCARYRLQEIFDVALNDMKFSNKVNYCLNGGVRRESDICICPPGFAGDSCEFPCGRNYFGRQCSKLCSKTEVECKGMVLCTPSFGCSCAPGYHGEKCLLECEEGHYGANCIQICGSCKGGCDRYSGNCRGECDSPYLIWPYCKHTYSYWRETPVVLNSSFNSINLLLNFSSSNIKKSFDETRFFMVQYRENTETSWSNCSYEIFNPDTTITYAVEQLQSGRIYSLRTLLVDETLKTNDPGLSKISEGMTKCSVSKIENNIILAKVTNSSVTLSWNKETSSPKSECPFSSYTLEITPNSDDSKEIRKIFNIKTNGAYIKYLTPDNSYLIELKKKTVHGESAAISSITVRTESTTDNTLGVVGVVKKIKGSDIYLQWLKNPLNKTYYIKYKLLKRLSCSPKEMINSSLQMVSTSSTNYTLSLEPNAQYVIFVTIDENQITSLENVTTFTDSTIPSTSPSFLNYKIKVTNETALVYWSDPTSSCTQMNGFFKNYMIQLLDSQNSVLNTYEVFNKHIEISKLSPKTDYKFRIRYINNIGHNPQLYAEYLFSTKSSGFLSAQNLTAYKATANLIGLRWKMPETNTTITGININIQNQVEKKSLNITDLTILQCKAWPSYVCYTIPNLKHSTKYEVSVHILSTEFPEGGYQKSIQVLTREAMPSPVTEIKVNDISKTNMTISWRIPNVLNGILRKFQIEVEHLSSFDETLCCQGVSTINYVVKEEQEIYSHVLENILTASSYQVTIRAFTRRLGQEASKIIETPPPSIPMKQKPQVSVDNVKVDWESCEVSNNTYEGSDNMNELVTDLLVIVQTDETLDSNTTVQPTLVRTQLERFLKSSNWWIAHVCGANKDCIVNLGTEKESDSPYGKIINKPLSVGHNYTILAAQINKHLSARSYTVVRSAPFVMKTVVVISTTTETIESTPTNDSNLPRSNETNDPPVEVNVVDYEELKIDDAPTTENNQTGEEEPSTDAPIDDYELVAR